MNHGVMAADGGGAGRLRFRVHRARLNSEIGCLKRRADRRLDPVPCSVARVCQSLSKRRITSSCQNYIHSGSAQYKIEMQQGVYNYGQRRARLSACLGCDAWLMPQAGAILPGLRARP